MYLNTTQHCIYSGKIICLSDNFKMNEITSENSVTER